MSSSRDNFVERLEIRLDEMSADLNQFESRVRNLDVDERRPHIEHLVELDERRDLLRKKIAALRRTGEASWKLHKSGAEKALTALVAGMADAKERLESQLIEN